MGPAETKYRQWIQGLHPLTPKQEAEAEIVFALAGAIDAANTLGKNLSSLAANSRALAAHVKEFRERVGAAMPPAPAPDAAPSTVDSADEVAAKRASRRSQGRQTG